MLLYRNKGTTVARATIKKAHRDARIIKTPNARARARLSMIYWHIDHARVNFLSRKLSDKLRASRRLFLANFTIMSGQVCICVSRKNYISCV